MIFFGLNSVSVLAQVNIGGSSGVILGIVIALAGASLYFLRSVRPELSRDHDIFFAAVGLLCGFILIFQGWRLDPILQFGQFLLTGSTIFFALETIRLRGIATEQAQRNTPTVDDERPVSRAYRAELDELEPYDEERYEKRRLRGYQEPRSNRRSASDESEYRRPRSRDRDNPDTSERYPRKRRPRPSSASHRSSPEQSGYDSWSSDYGDYEDREESSPPPRRPRRPRPSSSPPTESREKSRPPKRKRRPPRSSSYSYGTAVEDEVTPGEYVDYQPIDQWDEDADESPKDTDSNKDDYEQPEDREERDRLGNFDY